ncbi:amino acid permease [Nanoarchaeota archaeon]
MTELKKVLSFKVILLITINSIMGTGIYFLSSAGAKYSGPMSIISWAIMSFIALYIGMCFAELCSLFPKAGGVYEYCKQTYGRFPSFLVAWITLIAGYITIAMLIVGAIQYLLPFEAPLIKSAISIFFILLFNFIAYRGMKTSAFMLVTFSILAITVFISLIISGSFHVSASNFSPFFVFPFSAIFFTLFFIAETFFGWESATFLAEETKNPRKVMPKALIYGTIAIAVLAVSISVVSMGVVPWEQFGQSTAPLSDLAFALFGGIGKDIFTLAVYLAIIGAVACWVVAAPRLILALSRDRLFLPQFAKIHRKFHTPHKAILLQTIAICTLILLTMGQYTSLLVLLIPLVIVVYSFVLFAVVILRYKKPNLKRYFKVPFGKVGPILIILFNLFLIVMWAIKEEHALESLTKGLSLILLGIPIYLLLEMYYNPKLIRGVSDILAYLTLWTERLALPIKIRKQIIKLLGNIKGRTVLELGCNVGTLTMHLAEEVGPNGKVFATDFSKKEVAITQKRLMKKGHTHVTVIHDEQHHKRVHPSIKKIHTVVSVGVLSYLPNIHHFLTDVNKKLKKGSTVCFVDYDKFFNIIPNKEWLEDDKEIRRRFKNAGFDVEVVRKKGLAWSYVLIYGKKFKNA